MMTRLKARYSIDTSNSRSSIRYTRKLTRRKFSKESTIFNKYFNINYI